ncbi:MAG: thioesterase family protein [Nocardioidaceae bacterium]
MEAVIDSDGGPAPAFYRADEPGRFLSGPATASPWGPDSQHGGPPAALLARAIERLPRDAPRVVGRLTVELLGPVPVGRLRVDAHVVRPGRSVELCAATLYDEALDRPCARASAWLFPLTEDGPEPGTAPLPHTPDEGVSHDRPPSWSAGYLDAVDWRWIRGAVLDPGPAVVWMRPTLDLVAGEATTPVQRLMIVADSASGVSAVLDPSAWRFLNTELTVHVLRPPVGDWLCLDAETTLSSGRIGVATSRMYDARGPVARTAQALLIARR